MLTYQGNIITKHTDVNNWIHIKVPPNYNPLNLPPNTVRVRTNDGKVPKKDMQYGNTTYETATLVSGTSDVYDVYKSGTDFRYLLYMSSNVVEVLGANTSNVTDMRAMFENCESLTNIPLFDTTNVTVMSHMFDGCHYLTDVALFDTSKVTQMGGMFKGCSRLSTVPLFDTSNVTNIDTMFQFCSSLTNIPLFDTSKVTTMNIMFQQCTSLTTVPLFDTSNVTNMNYMFSECRNVQSGALALYNQVSTQPNPPTNHYHTFYNCGINTTTGIAEYVRIPSDWK